MNRAGLWRPWVALLSFLLSAAPAFASRAPRRTSHIRLVLVLVMDQGRADYLDRFAPVLRGGLARLASHGIRFRQAFHDHAITETSPGHASLSSGRFPSRSGIVANHWYDRQLGRSIYSVEDPEAPLLDGGAGRSPANLRVDTLPDWIRRTYPEAHIFSLSRKDRAAILMGGHHPDGVFWYDPASGSFTSSHYYMDHRPPWLEQFLEQHPVRALAGQLWRPLPFDPLLLSRLRTGLFWGGPPRPSFPHPLTLEGRPPADFFTELERTPFLDQAVLDLARVIVKEESLGQDEVPDYLAISFSSTDAVGHAYGPTSRELLDTIVRLDRWLGEFLEDLDRRVGPDHLLLAFSSDHGVVLEPESPWNPDPTARRLTQSDIECREASERGLEAAFGPGPWWRAPGYLDRQRAAQAQIEEAKLEQKAAQLLEDCPAVARVWTRQEIQSARSTSDPMLRLYRHSFYPERSPDIYVQYSRDFLPQSRGGSTHGSPYRYDRHVPLVLLVPGMAPRQIDLPVRTVDLAPTLASFLSLPLPSDLDGRDLGTLLR